MPPSGAPTRRPGSQLSHGGSANRPLYAIDFTAVACGKRIANTKRRVRWRFGFANPEALEAGATGIACRGEEHDVTMVWSITSGKRLILADGQEVHYSSSRSAVIDFSWTMRGNHVLKVVAHATTPMTVEPGFRQYDFFVDGRSFFSFPKVYRLGLTAGVGKMDARSPRAAGVGFAESSGRMSGPPKSLAQIEAPHNPDEEEAYLREAIKASLETESRRQEGKTSEKPAISAEATDLLIDFMDDWNATPTAAPVAAPAGNEWAIAPATHQQGNQWAASVPPTQPDNSWAQPPPAPMPIQQQQQQQAYGGPNLYASVQSNPFAPVAPTPVQQPPVQNFSGYEAPAADPFSMPAYAQPPSAPAYSQPAPVSSDPFHSQPPPVPAPEPAPNTTDGGSNVFLTMGSISTDGLLDGSNAPATGGGGATGGTLADKALQNLMGSIDSFGLTGRTSKPPAAAKNPFDTNNIMNNATLGEIKSSKTAEKKPVMNAPPGPGALVMGNTQTGNWGGYSGQSQYGGMGASMQQQTAPPQYTMSGGYPQQQQPVQMGMQQQSFGMQPQQSMMGQQPQQPIMGQQPQMGMMQGQPPMSQQGYGGAPQYGQQPPMQQNQWGAPYY